MTASWLGAHTPRKTTYRENDNLFLHTTDTGTSIDKDEPNSNIANTTTADPDHVNYDMEPSQELLENNDECIAPRCGELLDIVYDELVRRGRHRQDTALQSLHDWAILALDDAVNQWELMGMLATHDGQPSTTTDAHGRTYDLQNHG